VTERHRAEGYRQQAADDHRHEHAGPAEEIRDPADSIEVYFLYQMRFEFDAAKSAANKTKHGIDFVEAQALWSDVDRLEIPARSTSEPRYQVIGRIAQTLWSATVTYRHEETVRLISVRRARTNEQKQYVGT
jgi:hypothetical protein